MILSLVSMLRFILFNFTELLLESFVLSEEKDLLLGWDRWNHVTPPIFKMHPWLNPLIRFMCKKCRFRDDQPVSPVTWCSRSSCGKDRVNHTLINRNCSKKIKIYFFSSHPHHLKLTVMSRWPESVSGQTLFPSHNLRSVQYRFVSHNRAQLNQKKLSHCRIDVVPSTSGSISIHIGIIDIVFVIANLKLYLIRILWSMMMISLELNYGFSGCLFSCIEGPVESFCIADFDVYGGFFMAMQTIQ